MQPFGRLSSRTKVVQIKVKGEVREFEGRA